MKRVIGNDEELTVILHDEADETIEPTEMVIRKGPYGLYITFPDNEDQRCVMLDYFNGRLAVKVWADNDNEDFTDEVVLS